MPDFDPQKQAQELSRLLEEQALLLTILAAVLMSLSIRWEPTSLFNTLLMFGLLAAGVGLIARSLRPYPAG